MNQNLQQILASLHKEYAPYIQQYIQMSNSFIQLGSSMELIVKQYQLMAEEINKSLLPAIESWQRWAEENSAIFKNFSDYWDVARNYGIDEERVVSILRKYRWFMTPSVPHDFLLQLLQIDQQDGNRYRAVNKLFIDHYQANGWRNLELMVVGWKKNPLMKARYKIIKDCVGTIKGNKNKRINVVNPVLPTLITQIDGALTDYLNYNGLQWDCDYDDWKDKKGKITKVGRKTRLKSLKPQILSTPLYALAQDLILDILFQKTQKGRPLKRPFYFNRHKIIHGENTNYGRKDYMIRAFMLLDFLVHCYEPKITQD